MLACRCCAEKPLQRTPFIDWSTPPHSTPTAAARSVVSRRQLAAQAAVARRLADAAQRGGYGMPEASLREAHRDMVQPEGQPFSHIFTPDEVANILAGVAGRGCRGGPLPVRLWAGRAMAASCGAARRRLRLTRRARRSSTHLSQTRGRRM